MFDCLLTCRKELNIVHVCGKHFIDGKPALYETTDPNWIPTINLGYELVNISSPESTVARNDR